MLVIGQMSLNVSLLKLRVNRLNFLFQLDL